MPVDLEYVWRYSQFNESEKSVTVHNRVGCIGTTHGVLWDTTGTSFFQHNNNNNNNSISLFRVTHSV